MCAKRQSQFPIRCARPDQGLVSGTPALRPNVAVDTSRRFGNVRFAAYGGKAEVLPTIAASDLQELGLPDLSHPDAQKVYAELTASHDLIIADNLSTLCRGLKENEADSWTPVQNFALSL